ncbi:hypothetical protein K3495_g9202 [Podosphaera aphanis]|nr:hypothetical protein K3495_g9202 [Podosphaera aphanis]
MAELNFNALPASLDIPQDNNVYGRETVAGKALLGAHDRYQNIPNSEDAYVLRSLKPIHLWQTFN